MLSEFDLVRLLDEIDIVSICGSIGNGRGVPKPQPFETRGNVPHRGDTPPMVASTHSPSAGNRTSCADAAATFELLGWI